MTQESVIMGQFAGKSKSGGNYRHIRLDPSTESIQTIEYEHHEIHSGSHYFVVGYEDVAITEVMDFVWTMPDTSKWIHWTWKLTCEAETLFQVYEGAAITNVLANSVTPLNSNRNSTNTSGTTMNYEVHDDLATANADTDISGAMLIKTGVIGAGRNGGQDSRKDELILKQNTIYCLRTTANAAGYQNFHLNWYEHTDKN